MVSDAGSVQIVPSGRLVYGMQLPVQAQSTMFAAPWEGGAGAAELLRIAEACDRSGFFYVAVCDHVVVPRERAAAMRTTWYDTVATLGFLAAATRRVRLLSHVFILPYRHPLVSAKAFATLDALSGGRVILGVGAGHLEGEFATLGVDFKRRGKLLDEAIDLVKTAFREEFVRFEGATWKVDDVGLAPRPVQQPRPPIWIGGSTPAALRRAAERGDGWLPQGTPRADLPAAIETIRSHRRKTVGDRPIEIGTMSEWLYVGRPTFELAPGTRSGEPAELAEHLRGLKALGVSHCGVRFRARSCDELIEQIDAFGAAVGPLLND
ncbi:MAG TPA: TIGR03619 family F420-dependent LLM class oxidoreductase [Candidatus Binatia bacterium]|nr:TIGR03619 family F420-dependent LLM class oxidoreductase [Candidatus Binatia bacterium]